MSDAEVNWEPLDGFIFREEFISFLRDYRDLGNTGLPEAMDAFGARASYLKQHFPEKFPIPRSPRVTAFENLTEIKRPVLAIEALWDGDTIHEWFNVIFAITETLSEMHARYTAHYLCTVFFNSSELDGPHISGEVYCERLVEDLAAQANAQAHHAVQPPDDEAPRWWDLQDHRDSEV